MCKCTPSIKTPFCGKLNCQWPDEESVLTRASDFAFKKHKGQERDGGGSYFHSHIEDVVRILEVITNDKNILAAGYLHDTIEDTDTTYEELVKEFGQTIADLVMEVTDEGKKDSYGKYFQRLHSKEGVMIKLADRLSNVSQMDSWSEERREHYIKRTKFWKTNPEDEFMEILKRLNNVLDNLDIKKLREKYVNNQ